MVLGTYHAAVMPKIQIRQNLLLSCVIILGPKCFIVPGLVRVRCRAEAKKKNIQDEFFSGDT